MLTLQQLDSEERVSIFVERTGAARKTARDYLEAEEWNMADAATAYRGDREISSGRSFGQRNADHIDGYDRDDLGESADY